MESYASVDEFNIALWKRFQEGKIRNVYPLSKYNDIVKKIKTIEENPPCNMPGEYYLLRKFIVIRVAGKERLSCKPENGANVPEIEDSRSLKPKFYIALEEIYSYIDQAHKATKHGGRDRIVRILHNQGVVNVTKDTVDLFLSFCKVCKPRRKDSTRKCSNVKNVVSPCPIQNDSYDSINGEGEITDTISETESLKYESNDHNNSETVCSFTRGYIDLLDFTSTPDGDYRFIFLYLDLQTCFSILRPVRCRCTHELVSHLLEIFTLIGPPQVLHSNFEEQFLTSIIHELKQMWPESIIVCGAMNYVELQEVAQKCVSELYEMLQTWMNENHSRHWSFGLKFTQLRKNTKLIGNNAKSPYECFFGRSPRNANLPPNIDISLLSQAFKEDELLSLINQSKNKESEQCESLQVAVDPNICSLVQSSDRQEPPRAEPAYTFYPSIVKVEPASDEEVTQENGIKTYENNLTEMSSSPEIILKQEQEDS